MAMTLILRYRCTGEGLRCSHRWLHRRGAYLEGHRSRKLRQESKLHDALAARALLRGTEDHVLPHEPLPCCMHV